MITRNDFCWCGSGKKWKKCHFPAPGPANPTSLKAQYLKQYGIRLKTPEEIAGIRRACQLTARILDETCALAKAGVTTNELDAFAHRLHVEAGAVPGPLHYPNSLGKNYPPYPKSICTSLNEVICHGIPDDIPLREGDILNIDVSLQLDGYFGDCSRMVVIGKTSQERQHVVDVSYNCLMRAIAILKPGVLISAIGNAIESCATAQGCSVVDQFVGHGVGLELHEPPQIPHHYNEMHIPLAAGMTFTIEPMINGGSRAGHVDKKDHWTVRTNDGKPSAQWEHTLLLTDSGAEILTPWHK